MFNWFRIIQQTCMAAAPSGEPVWPPVGAPTADVPLYAWLALGCLVVTFLFALIALARRERRRRALALAAGIAFVLGFVALSAVAVQSDTAPLGEVGLFYLWGSFLPSVLIVLVLMTLILVAALRDGSPWILRLATLAILALAGLLTAGWSAVLYAMTSC